MPDEQLTASGDVRRCSACAHTHGLMCLKHLARDGLPRFIGAARADLTACGPQAVSFTPRAAAPQGAVVLPFPRAGRFA